MPSSSCPSGYVLVEGACAPRWVQRAYLKASNTGGGDGFESVSLPADGSRLAVGAAGEASNARGVGGNQLDNSAPGSGAVYVFVRTGTTWSQEAYVKASNADSGDGFGVSVSLSADGSRLAVGATGEDSNAFLIGGDEANNSAPGSGAVYVFVRTGTTWSQEAYIKAFNRSVEDFFGASVSLSGDGSWLAVGAHGEDSNGTGLIADPENNSAPESGAVYLFVRMGTMWWRSGYVKASNTNAGDLFGFSVSLSADGSRLAVGAYGEASNATGVGGDQGNNSAPYSGAVYVFVRSLLYSWSQEGYVKASNTDAADQFGVSVSLSADGSRLAVGADREDSNATGVGGDQANNGAPESGAVYIFARTDATWSQEAYVKASNTDGRGSAFGIDEGDAFGSTLSLSADGSRLAVGAVHEDSNATGVGGDQASDSTNSSGAVYVFSRSGAVWSQEAYVKASNTGANDYFGSALSLSADGSRLAVGAIGEASNATGVGGDEANNSARGSGAVYALEVRE